MPLDETTWIRLVNSLDHQTLNEAILDLQHQSAKFIGSRVHDRADAEDLRQQTFINLIEHIRSHPGPDHPITGKRHFLNVTYRIATLRIIDFLRRRKHQTVQIDESKVVDQTFEGDDDENEKIQKLNRAIEKLPVMEQSILKMKLAGHSSAEIADTYNLTVSNVDTKYGRVKTKLGRIIKGGEDS